MRRAGLFFAIAILLGMLLSCRADAADLYCSPAGTATAAGTQANPLDFAFAVGPASPVRPGDTLWLETGVYHYPFTPILTGNGERGYGFQIVLQGTAAAPITIRGMETDTSHVTIDGGLCLIPPATHLVIRDLEVTTLQPRPAGALSGNTVNLPIAWGGINLYSGDGCEILDCVVHGNCQGISAWQATANLLISGCVIYGDGWQTSPDGSGDGHEIYSQNLGSTGRKTITGNIIASGLSGYALHCYGEGGPVENYTVDHNVFLPGPAGRRSNELIGGNLPSKGIVFSGNDIYHESVILGWYAPYNEDCLIAGNNALQAGGDEFDIKNYVHTTLTDNVIEGWGANIVRAPNWTPPAGESWSLTASGNNVGGGGVAYMGFPAGWQPPGALASHVDEIYAGYIQVGGIGAAPAAPTVHVIPDAYNPDRAIVDVINWTHAASVSLDLSAVLKPGDKYRLMNPFDVYGTPVQSGVYAGPISVTPGEFSAYVLVRDRPTPAPPIPGGASGGVTLEGLAAELAQLDSRLTALEGRVGLGQAAR